MISKSIIRPIIDVKSCPGLAKFCCQREYYFWRHFWYSLITIHVHILSIIVKAGVYIKSSSFWPWLGFRNLRTEPAFLYHGGDLVTWPASSKVKQGRRSNDTRFLHFISRPSAALLCLHASSTTNLNKREIFASSWSLNRVTDPDRGFILYIHTQLPIAYPPATA